MNNCIQVMSGGAIAVSAQDLDDAVVQAQKDKYQKLMVFSLFLNFSKNEFNSFLFFLQNDSRSFPPFSSLIRLIQDPSTQKPKA